MKIRYLILIVLLLIPNIALAEPNATLTTNKGSIENGETLIATVTLMDTAAWNIVLKGTGASTCMTRQADVTSDGKSTTRSFTLSCVSKSEGTITLNLTGDITSGSGQTKDISLSKQVTVTRSKSSINTLNDLKVDGVTVPNFSSATTSYTLIDNTRTSINITATATDSKASITGTGTRSLNYGKNNFNIIVTAENGAKKTYTIIVNKPDSRSSNTNLKSLSLNKGTIDFNKNNTSYTVKYEHDINDITITATSEDSKSKVTGAGNKKLNDYMNEFKITVIAENGSTKTYVIKAIRKDSAGNYGKLDTDNSVKSITIKGYDLKFSKDIKKYNVLVEDVDKLEINVIPNSATATTSIENNENLKTGLNVITIKIVAENGNIDEYILNVYKIGKELASEEKTDDVVNNTVNCNEKINGNKTSIWFIISIIEMILLIGAISLIIYINKKKKQSNKTIDMSNENQFQ